MLSVCKHPVHNLKTSLVHRVWRRCHYHLPQVNIFSCQPLSKHLKAYLGRHSRFVYNQINWVHRISLLGSNSEEFYLKHLMIIDHDNL